MFDFSINIQFFESMGSLDGYRYFWYIDVSEPSDVNKLVGICIFY